MNEFERIAKVIHFLDQHHTEQPALETLAAQAGLSPFHFHRLFSRWAGITPKDFLQSPRAVSRQATTRSRGKRSRHLSRNRPLRAQPPTRPLPRPRSRLPGRDQSCRRRLDHRNGIRRQPPSAPASSHRVLAASATFPSLTQRTAPKPKPPFTTTGLWLTSVGTTRPPSNSPLNSSPGPRTAIETPPYAPLFAAAPFRFESGAPYSTSRPADSSATDI
jgi:hypothetical protein